MSRYQQGDTVNEARLLIPWYITGKLSGPERKLVESMLEQYPDLKKDYLREMRTVELLRSNDGLLHLTAVDTTQQRLDKLLKRIQREEDSVPDALLPASLPTSGKKSGIKFSWPGFFRSLWPSMEWLTPANAVFASLLLIQAGFIGWFAHSFMANGNVQESVYHTATADTNGETVPLVGGMVLLVDFNEDAPIKQVRDFLNKWNARVLDGPDANNLFKIEIRDVEPSDKRSDAVLQQMQQDEATIGFIGREF